ncbi:MAG: hypothetical protein IJD97_03700 [Clostridia bacterium]|nr:hypothetical protein [Clostridia bacterium]
MIDMHSHILPGIDDGARNIDEALAMLEDVYNKGCDTVVATPHLRVYSDEELVNAVKMRDVAYDALMSAAEKRKASIPRIKKGFEVHLDKDITAFSSFNGICIEGTDKMLVEMPMHYWDTFALSRIDNLRKNGIVPVIAHIDRYMGFKKNIENALSLEGVIYQVNAEAFFTFSGRRLVRRLLKAGKNVVAGSDMHNLTTRKSRLYEANKKMTGKYKGYEAVFYGNASGLLQ